MTRIAVVTAVGPERDAVARGVGVESKLTAGPYETVSGLVRADAEFLVLAAGVGPAAASAAAMALALEGVDILMSAGIGGGFADRAGIGEIVVASAVVAADLGAESGDGFLDLSALGFGPSEFAVDAAASDHTAQRLNEHGIAARRGPIVTVSTATGTDERAAQLSARYAATAEGMEGAGVAHVGALMQIPVVEIRAISNLVGRRDSASWDVPGALTALERAMRVLFGRS